MRHDVALILSFLSLLAFHATVRADSDVRFNPLNGHYYQRIDENLNWPAARDYCQNLAGPNGEAGYLTTITSELENQFVAQILNGHDGWAGGSDSEAEGIWQWVTGPEAGTVFWQGAGSASGGLPVGTMYTNWNGTSEPNSFGGNQDHLQLYRSGRWNDRAETASQPFVCEFPPRVYYIITVTCGENGAVEPYGNPPGVVAVEEGRDQTFTVIPDRGYRIETFLVDGGLDQLSTDNQYTLSNVQANHTIEVSFCEQYYEIVATASTGGGTITPTGTIPVLEGTDKSFTVASSSGHRLTRVQVDGSPVTLREGQYVFRNVSSDHTIAVSFEEIDSTELSTIGDTIPGCATGKSADYSQGFAGASLNFVNTELQENQVVLPTGYEAIDPDHIVIPFTQKVSVTFLYEGAGYKLSDFGWMLARDGVSGAKHEIYNNINDNDDNGVLDASINNTTNKYGDTNGDGNIDARDNRRFLDEIEGGTEIVFYLKVNNENHTYYTKTDWNTDTYTSNNGDCTDESFKKTYKLGQARTDEGTCQLESGWMSAVALQRVNELFDLNFADNDNYKLDIVRNRQFSHVVVGAPADKPNEWILGWEDLGGGGDTDHNDLIFIIERQTGGMVQPSEPIIPEQDEAYFTGATLRVYDDMPCPGQTDITYHVSVDNGANWFEITAWDTVSEFSVDENGSKIIGDPIDSWQPGSPASTYRTRRIDFAGLNLTGRELIWKADFKSQQQGCEPKLMGLSLAGSIATQGIFSRSSPIIKSNVLYSGSYATPAASWTDKVMRGHLVAWRVYDPSDPDRTATEKLWDAGEVLSQKENLSTRKILFPRITTGTVNGQIGTGGQGDRTFSGDLLGIADRHILPTTLVITDGREIFRDEHTDVLRGSLGGTGFINRFTGEFNLTFNSPPDENVRIMANCTYYQSSEQLADFVAANVTPAMLGVDETLIEPQGYLYDFNEDGRIDQNDADWLVNWVRGYKDGVAIAKEWPLGPIDHSAPALETPPGTPIWFFGTSVPDAVRQSFLDFKNENSQRPAVIYVGSRDGMLHAFDAGGYRHGDNPQTSFAENRGYFERFAENTSDCPDYCDGDCSTCPDYGTGQELWAFIPANLLPRLKYNRLKGDDQAYVDASPALADVYIRDHWKTVLLAAEGNGGDTVFCLDVTDPQKPSFLWEFADPDLFRSRSSPSIAKIGLIQTKGSSKWAAFFVSGKTEDPELFPSIYIIDIATGGLIERVFLNSDSDGRGGVPSGQPTIIDSDGNGYIDRLYIGTDKGFLYKINIPDDPLTENYAISHCVINRDFTDDQGESVPTMQHYHPVYGSPVAVLSTEVTEEAQLRIITKIFFGTGDSPYYDEGINATGDETRYHFFAYRDENGKGQCDETGVSLDWFRELPAGHRIFASAFAAAGNIYFGTATSETEDPCETGSDSTATSGTLYIFNYEGDPVTCITDLGSLITPPLVEDQHLYVKSQALGLRSLGQGIYNNPVRGGGRPEVALRSWKEVF